MEARIETGSVEQEVENHLNWKYYSPDGRVMSDVGNAASALASETIRMRGIRDMNRNQ